ncbi:peptide-methionine (S)-S-oxide reductase MsrA [Deinococcus sp. Marseille-Q6407]|uniref:peptide-methionine (S)-S-oxide reductase MsrA n=1 Tax=Deinococcus sp. Marseille-Q6407 TaxID=2969223 RepID=UPI0021C1802F|nr:peptide-methionine (S)-S-oxide reductase MsrA [Deinococcus sp. Marseille-Q6407]
MTQSEHGTEQAIFAGGCFWCTEAVMLRVCGVQRVESGYIGGRRPNPSYEQVCTGVTGHAEAVRVTFDPAQVTYRDLLHIFFGTHDPTSLNRQGADRGTQYRSALFPLNDAQRAEAQAVIDELNASTYDGRIVTSLEDNSEFYVAEDYHQDYFANNPQNPYCGAVVAPKVAKLRQSYSHFLSE